LRGSAALVNATTSPEFFTWNGLGTYKAFTDTAAPEALQIAFGSDGLLYGYSIATNLFYTIDPTIGTLTVKASSGLDFSDLAGMYACTWKGESAWADGERYIQKGNWATVTAYNGEAKEVPLYADQNKQAGTVAFSAPIDGQVTITITLNEGWRFADKTENVKIQDYATKPSETPAPGEFNFKATAAASPFDITVNENFFYGVHVEVDWVYCYYPDKAQ
jgi:hypothetical protein